MSKPGFNDKPGWPTSIFIRKHMSSLAIIIIVIALLFTTTGSLVYYNFISFRKVNKRLSQQRFERVQSLYNKLESGQLPATSDIYEYAKNVLTRQTTFQLLQNRNLINLFPEEFYTMEKAAESNLANWLEFPTELGTCPDEIEYLEKVTIDLDDPNLRFHYYVYQFKMNHDHWSINNGWMLGVVGPYFDNSKPYDHPNSTFSRLRNRADTNLPDEEAKWVHENISLPFVSTT